MINLPAKGRVTYLKFMKGCANDDFPKEDFVCGCMPVYDFRNDACCSAGCDRKCYRCFR